MKFLNKTVLQCHIFVHNYSLMIISMFWFLLLHVLSDVDVKEIMPAFGLQFALRKYETISYSSLDQCLLSELTIPRDQIEVFLNIRNNERWQEIKKANIDSILKDQNNPLTEDEKFAIFLYSYHPFFYTGLSLVLNLGVTGHYNCYFEYLMNGFEKINASLTETTDLYRGVGQIGDVVHPTNYKEGDIIQTTSFTSTSLNKGQALKFGFNGKFYFAIKALRNPRSIIQLSAYPSEYELLYPPSTKFKVLSNPKTQYCAVNLNTGEYDCQETRPTEDYQKYTYIELEEIDSDYGPFQTIVREELNNASPDHLDVKWWGWLLIGLACGIVFAAIISVVVICVLRGRDQNSSKNDSIHNDRSQNEEL